MSDCDRVQSRLVLTVGAVTTIMISYIEMIAVSSLLGFQQAGMHQLLPFLILGIGFDDIYVMVRGYDIGSKHHKSHKMIMQHCLANNGISITISSLTNVIGFGSG